jgi:FMN-dependent dehydrogenase
VGGRPACRRVPLRIAGPQRVHVDERRQPGICWRRSYHQRSRFEFAGSRYFLPQPLINRGTHVLKALSLGAKACSGGRFYLYALAAAGQVGVERALQNLHNEIERDMKLMGCRSINELSRENLRFR